MIRTSRPYELACGNRVAIIGGGPAGSFAALHLLHFAARLAIPLSVTVFEYKDFSRRGPAGCNKCAGIISSRAMHGLAELGLQIPEHLVLARLEGYTLHIAGHAIDVTRPDRTRTILSVYRGGGPLHGDLPPTVSFDGWLLSEAQAAGAVVIAAKVSRIIAGPLVDVEADGHRESFHLVMLATGVNAKPPALEGFNYVSPHTETMAQNELRLQPPLTLAQRRQAHVYIGDQPGLIFGTLIPKGEYLNLSLLAHRFVGDPVKSFLARGDCTWLREAKATGLCGCRPQIAVSSAKHPFGDRFVAVGDVAATRLYKDGIGSASVTARQAAWTALHAGVSEAAFACHYAPLWRSIVLDNLVGKLLFAPWNGRESRLHQLWDRGWSRILLAETRLPANRRPAHRALWGMLTGDDSYTHIALNALRPQIFGELIAGLLSAGGLRRDDPGTAREWLKDRP